MNVTNEMTKQTFNKVINQPMQRASENTAKVAEPIDNSNKIIKPPSLHGDCVESKRAELKCYFQQTWQKYESLFSLINNDNAFYKRPEPLRHPLIFYYGHTACFYINKLILGKFIGERINPKIEAICAVGVDEMSWDDLNSAHYDWPSVDEVASYRKRVATKVEWFIDTMELSLPVSSSEGGSAGAGRCIFFAVGRREYRTGYAER